MPKRFLIKHVGNMGDFVFFIPPVLASLKKHYPSCQITLVTAWGYKDQKGKWGKRNQGGFCISLAMTDPHIDELIHWHDTALSLDSTICCEGTRCFPTWNADYYQKQKISSKYDAVYELDFGLGYEDNPIQRMYETVGLTDETFSQYQLYLTEEEKSIAEYVMRDYPRPRIFLLEGLAGRTTRGWDPGKIPGLTAAIWQNYGATPIWFGSAYTPDYHGRPLTLRENIALLTQGDVGIGVMSAPLHFAAAVGLPTITLYGDQPLHRAAPAHFMPGHRTIMAPCPRPYRFLKGDAAPASLTPRERETQGWRSWMQPGRQSTKGCLAVVTVDEIVTVLHDMLPL